MRVYDILARIVREGYESLCRVGRVLWETRIYSKVLMRGELEERVRDVEESDREVLRLRGVVRDLGERIIGIEAEYNKMRGVGEEHMRRANEFAEIIGRLEKEVNDARRLVLFEKDKSKKITTKRKEAEKRFLEAHNLLLFTINTAVEHGVNPSTYERDGRYAFVDRKGRITAMSYKAQRVFGYSPGEVGYHEIISEDVAGRLVSKTGKAVGNIEVKVREGKIEIKDVAVKPLLIGDFYLGSVVDFKELGIVEKLRKKLQEGVVEKAKGLIEEVKEDLGNDKIGNLGVD